MTQPLIHTILPYLHLMRLHKPVGIGLLMLPCWWGVLAHRNGMSAHDTRMLLGLLLLGSVLMRSAGCVVNDMADHRFDAQVARTASRPLASGVMRTSSAMWLTLALLACAAVVARCIGWDVFFLGMAWLPLVMAYPFMKRLTYWPQAFLGITFGSGALFGTMATLHHLTPIAWWLYAGSIFWVIGYDTIYACQDRIDDARIGLKSTALRFGEHVRAGVAGCYVVAGLCWSIAFLLHTSGDTLPILGGMVTLGLLIYQIQRMRTYEPTPYQQLFTLNLWVGIAMCVAFG
jgi:4-hydroxybenzoate polyprenyltransferase